MRRGMLIGLSAVMALACVIEADDARAGCAWDVSGQLGVHDNVTTWGSWRALEGIEVRVSGSLLARGGFTSWGVTTTDYQGRFRMVRDKNCWRRRIRVEVRLNSPDLQVKNGSGSEWVVVYEHASKQYHRARFDVGRRTFTGGAGGSALTDFHGHRRALTWYMVKRLMDRLEDIGPWYGFPVKLNVKYPANTLANSSWAAFNTAYIHADAQSDSWSPEVVFHEVAHIWNYRHNSGVTNWLAAVLWDFNTHGEQENPNIAFHEGFAEYFGTAFLAELWPERFWEHGWWRGAWDRFDTLAQVERNDSAVTQAMRLMTSGLVGDVDLFDTLRVFRANPIAGWPQDLELGKAWQGLFLYLERAADVLPGYTEADLTDTLATLTPR